MNDDRYRFPGPGKSFYLLTVSRGCRDCDAPPGVTLELIEPKHCLYKEYKRGGFDVEPLTFERWADTKGVAFIAGMTAGEFVKAMTPHLVGLNSKDFGRNGKIDKIGAETIVEEMYADSIVKPHRPASRG